MASINKNSNFGFIITRHVNSEKTNKYWNECVRRIRRYYPLKKIVIIDDNSNSDFLKPEFEYKNIEYIQSEYCGRGELLPYYYLFKNEYFDNAVIIHDSIFFQKRVSFEKLIEQSVRVLPLWHFTCEKMENLDNTKRLVNSLSNNAIIMDTILKNREYEILGLNNKNVWAGCFGVQSFINREFLIGLSNKYDLFSLLNGVTSRPDRCCLERIMGAIFYIEYLKVGEIRSLLGNIRSYCNWGYTYDEHRENSLNKKVLKLPVVKVWSGR